VDIFSSLDSTVRTLTVAACLAALRPGGFYIAECFAPRHHEVRDQRACGPSQDRLVSTGMLEEAVSGIMDVLVSVEVEKRVNEGRFHRGPSVVTQFVARKPFPKQPEPSSFCRDVDRVFEEFERTSEQCKSMDSEDTSSIMSSEGVAQRVAAACIDKESNLGKIGANHDRMLFCAEAGLSIACAAAAASPRCRYCWVQQDQCYCAQIEQELPVSTGDANVRFSFVCHPNEFLRSTSSAKVASRLLGDRSEMLVLGSRADRGRLEATITPPFSSPKTTYILFPEGPPEETLSVSDFAREIAADATTTNVLIPDGSWECCRSIVQHIQQRQKAGCHHIKYVTLDAAAVRQHHSPLIEALKEGQGLGRISTLEACGLFLNELNQDGDALMRGMQPLVAYVQGLKRGPPASRKKPRHFTAWVQALRCCAQGSDAAPPPGLRHCSVCSETLATPVRLLDHVRGKKHCEMVMRWYVDNVAEQEPTDELARVVYHQGSVDPLALLLPEPPDVALVSLTAALRAMEQEAKDRDGASENSPSASSLTSTAAIPEVAERKENGGEPAPKKKQGGGGWNKSKKKGRKREPKGEHLVRMAPPPQNVVAFPPGMRAETTFAFDAQTHNLRAAVTSFLRRTGAQVRQACPFYLFGSPHYF
jgi:DTW domain-containing protein YfiP